MEAMKATENKQTETSPFFYVCCSHHECVWKNPNLLSKKFTKKEELLFSCPLQTNFILLFEWVRRTPNLLFRKYPDGINSVVILSNPFASRIWIGHTYLGGMERRKRLLINYLGIAIFQWQLNCLRILHIALLLK